MKSVLIVGGSGFLGSHLALRLRDSHKVFATYHRNPITIPGVTFLPMDAGDEIAAKRIVYFTAPDVVIYAAGSSEIDWVENHARDAERAHVAGVANVLKSATIFQSRFIQLSTCHIFDGQRGNYKEPDIVLASTALGKLKLSAENQLRSRAIHYSIVRLSPVYGRGNGLRTSMMDHLRLRLSRGLPVEAPGSILHSFVSISSVVEVVSRLVEGAGPRNKSFHYGGLTKCTYWEFCRQFARSFGYDEKLVHSPPGTGAGNEWTSDLSLNSTETVRTLKVQPLLLEEGLDLIQKELVPSL